MKKKTTVKRNTQVRLSDEDKARLQNLVLRGQLLAKEQQIIALETQKFQGRIHAAYGNPGETIAIGDDGAIMRRPLPEQ